MRYRPKFGQNTVIFLGIGTHLVRFQVNRTEYSIVGGKGQAPIHDLDGTNAQGILINGPYPYRSELGMFFHFDTGGQ